MPPDLAAIIDEGLRLAREGEQDEYWLYAATHFPTLADALADHREQVAALEKWNDKALATPEFCESLGLEDTSTYRDERSYRINRILIKFFACEGPLCWSTAWTKAQVHHLLAALTEQP